MNLEKNKTKNKANYDLMVGWMDEKYIETSYIKIAFNCVQSKTQLRAIIIRYTTYFIYDLY